MSQTQPQLATIAGTIRFGSNAQVVFAEFDDPAAVPCGRIRTEIRRSAMSMGLRSMEHAANAGPCRLVFCDFGLVEDLRELAGRPPITLVKLLHDVFRDTLRSHMRLPKATVALATS